MSATSVGTVMDSLGTALATITGLRVFDFPPKSAQPPFAYVGMPESVDFDLTYGRGFDRMTIPIYVAVADVVDRAARDQVTAYAAASGATSVKAAIEAAAIGESVRVTRVEFAQLTIAGVSYAGAVFHVDVQA